MKSITNNICGIFGKLTTKIQQESIQIGDTQISVPSGMNYSLLSREVDRDKVMSFIQNSPEFTVYHSPIYIELAKKLNGAAELILISSKGHPLFAIPIHPKSPRRISTGYSGILFPNSENEAVIKRSVRALSSFFTQNPKIEFEIIQSLQAATYENRSRLDLLLCSLARVGISPSNIYSRFLDLAYYSIDSDLKNGSILFDNSLLKSYEVDIRNQIRQAIKNGITINYIFDSKMYCSEILELEHFLAEKLQGRGAKSGHTLEYLEELGKAITKAGGKELTVIAKDIDGNSIAFVTCHLFRNRAIYWGGGSSDSGKKQRANPLALHAAITICKLNGINKFEIGRFNPQEPSPQMARVDFYKANFRGGVVPLISYTVNTKLNPNEYVKKRMRQLLNKFRDAY